MPLQKPFCHNPTEYSRLLYQIFASTFSANVCMHCFSPILTSNSVHSSPPYHPSKILSKVQILRPPPLGHPQFCPTSLHFLCLSPSFVPKYFTDVVIQHDVSRSCTRLYGATNICGCFNGLYDVTNHYLQFISFSDNDQLDCLRVARGRLSFCKIL